jgi:peptidoglycan/LPS O-acetylase OafA/YrhL
VSVAIEQQPDQYAALVTTEQEQADTRPVRQRTLDKPAPQPSYYRPQLDGLRFLAFLAVYFQHTFHAGPEFYVSWAVLRPFHVTQAVSTTLSRLTLTGGMGVDLFFALSSYLITELLLREIGKTGQIHLKNFYIRRVLRIWPVYAIVLFLGIVVLPLLRLSDPIPTPYVMGYLLFSGNWMSAILGNAWVLAPIGSLWSISVEEQFYLFWPLTIRKLGVLHLKAICFALIATGELSRLIMTRMHVVGDFAYYNTFTHLDAIAWGALFALYRIDQSAPPRIPRFLRTLMATGFLGYLAFALLYNNADGYVSNLLLRPLLSLFCPLIILLALRSNLLGLKPFPYLGRISYGLYAYHAMVIFLLDKVVPSGSALKLLMIPGKFLIALAIASISYRLIERPVLVFKDRFAFVHSRPV